MTRLSLALALLLVACTDGGLQDDPTATPTGDTSTPTATEPQVMEITVDTTAGAYVDLATGATVDHTPQSAATDAFGWHLFLDGADVFSNGGISGSGLCSLVLLDEPDSDAVEALEALQSPPPSWEADRRFDALGTQWHNYNQATGLFTAVPDVGYLVRGGEGTSYARVRVEAFDCPTRSGEGIRDFGVAIEVDTGEGFAAPVIFAGTIGAEGGARCVDFDAGAEAAVACEGTAWDLMIGFEGRDLFLRTNSGDAGDGEGGALGPYAWEALSSWASATVDPDGTDFAPWFLADTSNSVLGTQPWYAYSLEGNHLLWPNHRVYGVVRGEGEPWFAVQVLDYYDEGGASGHVSLRWVAP